MAGREILFAAVGLLLLVAYSHQAEPQISMDQLITNAAKTSTAFDFIQNDDTLLVELDIKYYKDDWKEIEDVGLAKTEKRRRRALARIKRKGIHGNRWTNNIVPYTVARYFKDEEKAQITSAFAEYHRHTCLQFKERTSESNYIALVDGGGCSSFVGMKGGEQEVTLGRGCRQLGIIMHEVGHAMGFHHEQTRPDRDNYVTIMQSNIPPNVYFNFQKYTSAVIKDWGVPYDYSSVMHYGASAFSYNGQPTIVAKQKKYQDVMGNRSGFSFRDIKLLNTMYECSARCPNKPTCPGEAFVDKSCKCICPGQGDAATKECTTGDTGHFDGAEVVATGGSSSGSSGGSTVVGACDDKKSDCTSWASRGYCKNSYVSYMRTNCAKSCGLCSKAATSCKDEHEKCYVWAYVGECQRNADWMKSKCKKSCNVCAGQTQNPTSDCIDMNNHCVKWAMKGECKKNPAFMHNYCKKSCNRCGAMGDYSGVANCLDSNVFCKDWARRGECNKNPLYMQEQCKLSCGKCAGSDSGSTGRQQQQQKQKKKKHRGRSGCKDKNKHCGYWARTNECRNNPAYMHPNCPKSCRRC